MNFVVFWSELSGSLPKASSMSKDIQGFGHAVIRIRAGGRQIRGIRWFLVWRDVFAGKSFAEHRAAFRAKKRL